MRCLSSPVAIFICANDTHTNHGKKRDLAAYITHRIFGYVWVHVG
jgi:hypothetical protein